MSGGLPVQFGNRPYFVWTSCGIVINTCAIFLPVLNAAWEKPILTHLSSGQRVSQRTKAYTSTFEGTDTSIMYTMYIFHYTVMNTMMSQTVMKTRTNTTTKKYQATTVPVS